MQRKPKAAVLLSTYNGERYLKEQVDSILSQKGVDVELYVRDDGSHDQTLEILRSYKRKNIHIASDGENLGPGMSFIKLLYIVGRRRDADFYAFADQDDIWLGDKLSKAVSMILDEHTPLLYCSNQTLYEDGEETGLRFREEPDLTLAHHIHKNELSGCTMVLNSALAKCITDTRCPGKDILDYRMHDAWIFLVALIQGQVVYDPDSSILYRIHGNNTVGVKEKSITQRLARLMGLGKEGRGYRNVRQKSARLLLREYPEMREDDRAFLELFSNYRDSLRQRLALATSREAIERSNEKRAGFILKVFLGLV